MSNNPEKVISDDAGSNNRLEPGGIEEQSYLLDYWIVSDHPEGTPVPPTIDQLDILDDSNHLQSETAIDITLPPIEEKPTYYSVIVPTKPYQANEGNTRLQNNTPILQTPDIHHPTISRAIPSTQEVKFWALRLIQTGEVDALNKLAMMCHQSGDHELALYIQECATKAFETSQNNRTPQKRKSSNQPKLPKNLQNIIEPKFRELGQTHSLLLHESDTNPKDDS